jgi:diguanylate cyclase (GGDEF)-like protein
LAALSGAVVWWNSETTAPLEQRSAAVSLHRKLVASRPRPVWTLATLEVVGAAVCFGAAFAPVTMHRFVEQGVVCGLLLAAVALGVWLLDAHLGRYGLLVATVLAVSVVSALVVAALTAQGVISASFAYLWTTVYGASFFHRRQLYVLLGFTAAGSGVALALSGLHRWESFWVLLLVTTVMTGVILERSVGQLRRDAETDALTGLLNRRGFFKAAALERSIADRAGLALAIVVIDLDNFKAVNDAEGHAAGDQALVEATSAWQSEMRAGDLLARFGGDEFVMLLSGISPGEVQRVVERCQAAHPIAWTCGSVFLIDGESIDACIGRADQLLYKTKDAGRS